MSDGKVSLVFGADAGNVPQVVGQINAKLQGMAAAGESAGAGVSRGLTAAGGAAGTAGTKFDRLLKAAGPLGGVLSRISPEAGAADSSIAGLTGTAEAMAAGIGTSFAAAGAAIGVVTAVLGVGYLAWKQYNDEVKRQEDMARIISKGSDIVREGSKRASDALRDLKKETGTLTLAEEKLLITREESERFTKEMSEQLSTRLALQGRLAAAEQDGRMKAAAGTREELALLDVVIAAGEKERDSTIASRQLTAEYDYAKAESERVLADRAERRAKAEAEAAEKEAKRAKAASDAAAKRRQEEEEANEAAKRTTEDDLARFKRLDDDRMEKAKKRLKAFREEEQAKKEAAEAELARIAEEQRAATEALQARLSTAASVTGSLTGLLTQLNEQQLDSIDTSTQAGREAAKQQWEQNKGAAFAMSVVQAALGVAIASASAPPPLNIPAIIQSTVAGAAATAAIAAAPPPKFHAGTARVDEVNATLKKGEAVLSTQGVSAAGREAVGRWNSGRDSGQTTPAVVMQYRHQVFNRFIRDNLRMNTPLAAAVKRGSVGFRDRV